MGLGRRIAERNHHSRHIPSVEPAADMTYQGRGWLWSPGWECLSDFSITNWRFFPFSHSALRKDVSAPRTLLRMRNNVPPSRGNSIHINYLEFFCKKRSISYPPFLNLPKQSFMPWTYGFLFAPSIIIQYYMIRLLRTLFQLSLVAAFYLLPGSLWPSPGAAFCLVGRSVGFEHFLFGALKNAPGPSRVRWAPASEWAIPPRSPVPFAGEWHLEITSGFRVRSLSLCYYCH